MDVGDLVASGRSGTFVPPKETPDDFETFLRMLTTQIQNQDPLSPMEAEQFASQLATFTMVEQQTLANQKLEVLVNELAGGEPLYASSLLGREVLHAGAFEFSGGPITFEVDEAGLGPDVRLRIIDSLGNLVAEADTNAGAQKVIWNGQDSDGHAVSAGVLVGELWRVSDNQKLDAPVYTSAVVEEVRFGGAEPQLLLSDGTVINESGVAKLRAAAQSE
ncbi:hypothetical protein MWU54_08590 [Marivita sp. S6314]|uniref:flagellar hook assembly protein FlgD n=1 Tax=Marivita sp. S6314 TaxID=2926406 RepID=UPI001FF68E0B|nr:hypothetical protein [Marivita sp. S6314]